MCFRPAGAQVQKPFECPQCNKPVSAGSDVCPNCGYELSEQERAQAGQAPAGQAGRVAPRPWAPPPGQAGGMAPPRPKVPPPPKAPPPMAPPKKDS